MNAIQLSQTEAKKPVSNAVLGMVLLVITEIMFFAGLISAYLVNRAGVAVWPPNDQPRLPIEITAVNTLILILSGVFFYMLIKTYLSKRRKSIKWLVFTMLFAVVFVGIQGYEWIRLLHFGLTSTSSIYGAFFYSIIGMHALHVLIGLAFLAYLWVSIRKNAVDKDISHRIHAVGIFWYFVVAIWPILYYLVYLY